MSSLFPTSVSFSLERLTRRGGAEGPHRDGWGVAFYSGRDALLLREAGAASESELVKHIEQHGPPSELVISHIRLASFGARTLANTQPFVRELGGSVHAFAHNGDLPEIEMLAEGLSGRFTPVGETDSERAFCVLLDHLAGLWDKRVHDVPPIAERLALIDAFAESLRELGPANFLYSDSHTLFVHADRRVDIDSGQQLPGLYLLSRSCKEEVPDLAESGVVLQTARQALTLVASVPLTDEPWRELACGEVLAIANGDVLERRLARSA